MATVAMSQSVNRIAVATIATDVGTWGNDGGGGGVSDETDIVYQTTTAQSRKVGTSQIGRDYTDTGTVDMDGSPASTAHLILKCNATTQLSLRSVPGMELKIGSGSTAYYQYNIFGSDNYPPRGGWQILAVAPSVSGYRDGTQGSPALGSVAYYSLLGDFAAVSKAENLVIDAIDVGLGLFLVNGDGASADGVWQDFVDHDEGTTGNRWGFVYTEGGVLFCTGQLTIGQTSAATSTITEFTDSGKTLVWNNGMVTTGFHRLLIDLATSGTAVDMTNCSLGSLGQEDNDGDRGYTTTEDSRPIFQVTGAHASADLTMTSCVFDNWSSFVLNLQCVFTNCVFTNSGEIDCGTGAQLTGATISGYTGDGTSTDLSTIEWDVNLDPDGDLDGVTITKGTNPHHAIEFGTTAPLTMTLTDWTTSGFHASDGNFDSTLYFADRGSDVTWTVNIAGGSGNFSYKKARGTDTVIVQTSVTLTVTVEDSAGVAIVGAKVAIYTDPGGTQLMNEDTIAGGIASESYNYTGDQAISIRVRESPNSASGRYIPFFGTGTIENDGFSVTVRLEDETIAQVV